jgi:hypothetical protein
LIVFSPLRTKRLSVSLSELTIENVIHLLKMPVHLNEAGTTAMLNFCVVPDARPRVGQVTDPRLWTVQERSMVVAHYIAHANEGEPDFPIGDGKFSDFLIDVDSPPESVTVGGVGGDIWMMRPLLGAHAESIERLVGSGVLSNDRAGWWFGAMAAQLYRDADAPVDIANISDDDLDCWILDRANAFKKFPERDGLLLITLFIEAQARMNHLLNLEFLDDGLAFSPKGGRDDLAPARFPFRDAISEVAVAAFGKLE